MDKRRKRKPAQTQQAAALTGAPWLFPWHASQRWPHASRVAWTIRIEGGLQSLLLYLSSTIL